MYIRSLWAHQGGHRKIAVCFLFSLSSLSLSYVSSLSSLSTCVCGTAVHDVSSSPWLPCLCQCHPLLPLFLNTSLLQWLAWLQYPPPIFNCHGEDAWFYQGHQVLCHKWYQKNLSGCCSAYQASMNFTVNTLQGVFCCWEHPLHFVFEHLRWLRCLMCP